MTAILSRPQYVNKGNNVYDHETPYLIYSYDSFVNWIYIISKVRLSLSINRIMDHCLRNACPLMTYDGLYLCIKFRSLLLIYNNPQFV